MNTNGLAKLLLAGALSIALVGCGGTSTTGSGASSGSADSGSSAVQESAEQTETAAKPDFDGTGMTETGDCTFYVATPGGTSEDGNIPQVAVPADTEIMQIEYDITGGDGTICTVYLDGMEVEKTNAGDSQTTLDLQGDALKDGVHKVELVAMDGDNVVIYKLAQFEIVH